VTGSGAHDDVCPQAVRRVGRSHSSCRRGHGDGSVDRNGAGTVTRIANARRTPCRERTVGLTSGGGWRFSRSRRRRSFSRQ
jgi:hypothetical protein